MGWRLAIGETIPGFLLIGFALWRSVPAGRATEETAADGGLAICDELATVWAAIASRRVALAVIAVTLMLFSSPRLTAFLTTKNFVVAFAALCSWVSWEE